MSTSAARQVLRQPGPRLESHRHLQPAAAAAQADRHVPLLPRARGRRPRHRLGRADRRRPARGVDLLHARWRSASTSIPSSISSSRRAPTSSSSTRSSRATSGRRRVRAGRPEPRTDPVRSRVARVRHRATTSRWSCSASTPRGRVADPEAGQRRRTAARPTRSAARREPEAPERESRATRGRERSTRWKRDRAYFKFAERGTDLGTEVRGGRDHVHGHGLHHLPEPEHPRRRAGLDPVRGRRRARRSIAGIMTIAMGVVGELPARARRRPRASTAIVAFRLVLGQGLTPAGAMGVIVHRRHRRHCCWSSSASAKRS